VRNYYYVLAKWDRNRKEFVLPLERERFLFFYKNNPLPLIKEISNQENQKRGIIIIEMNSELKNDIESLIEKKYYGIFRCGIFRKGRKLLVLSREEDISTLIEIFKEFKESFLVETIHLLRYLKDHDILVRYNFCRNLESHLNLMEEDVLIWEPNFFDIAYTILLWKSLCSLEKLYIGLSLPWKYSNFRFNGMTIDMVVEKNIYFMIDHHDSLKVFPEQLSQHKATLICKTLEDISPLLGTKEGERIRVKLIDNLYRIEGNEIYKKIKGDE